MGRTIPSFTLAMLDEIAEWKPFRQALDRSERKNYDDMLNIHKLYSSSCMMSANPIVIHPMFMSIIFRHFRQLEKLVERVNALDGTNHTEVEKGDQQKKKGSLDGWIAEDD